MRAALVDAVVEPEAMSNVTLHATAPQKKDAMEGRAMETIFSRGVPCSGTKPLTGHMLGASGATELAFCWLTLCEKWNPQRRLPPHRWDGQLDPSLPKLCLVKEETSFTSAGNPVMMSNSFAFGGSNVSLIIGRVSS